MRRQKIASIAFIILFLLSIMIMIQLSLGRLPLLDRATREFVPLFTGPIYSFFRYVTELGSKTFVIPIVTLFACILYMKTKRVIISLLFLASILFAHLTNVLLKHIFLRERPSMVAAYDALGYSFPSGHAMVSFVTYALIAYFLLHYIVDTTWETFIYIAAILLIGLIGFSRFVLNVHFLTDIIVGYFFGSIVFYLTVRIAKKIKIE